MRPSTRKINVLDLRLFPVLGFIILFPIRRCGCWNKTKSTTHGFILQFHIHKYWNDAWCHEMNDLNGFSLSSLLVEFHSVSNAWVTVYVGFQIGMKLPLWLINNYKQIFFKKNVSWQTKGIFLPVSLIAKLFLRHLGFFPSRGC